MATPATDHAHAPALSKYFVPDPSVWPFILTFALFTCIIGGWGYLEDQSLGPVPPIVGATLAFYIIFRWVRDVCRESEAGRYNAQVDSTFRWGMSWFIFSEVMFFAAFFGALWYAREMSVPWLSGEGAKLATHLNLWPGFENTWPTNGPSSIGGKYETVGAWGLPFVNTVLLLTSGVTLETAHHALKENKRKICIFWMWMTVALGALFLYFQATEYIHAYHELNLKLSTGVYGSTFFMLTGFHGFHVTLGTLMLAIIAIRLMCGHFKPDSHFGFEGVAWYWHFVDVVWIGLFIFVYIA